MLKSINLNIKQSIFNLLIPSVFLLVGLGCGANDEGAYTMTTTVSLEKKELKKTESAIFIVNILENSGKVYPSCFG